MSGRPVLPPRYEAPWRDLFEARVHSSLDSGVRVLDVGAGIRPTIAPEDRPASCLYAAIDLSRLELERAPAGSYDEIWEHDVAEYLPSLVREFDLIVSWDVLEHVRPLGVVIENLRSYLRPGGRLVAQFSGAFSVFGVANRILPRRVKTALLSTLLDRDPATTFPAYYDDCLYGRLTELLAGWSYAEIFPLYQGAGYFNFSELLQHLYVRYEDWALRGDHRNLATHYLVDAVR
jgi:SAM-dependent methyltransferase